MKQTTNPITARMEWCRRQSAQARTEPEIDGWSAEADGLRDALLNRDHTDAYRLCPPEILGRYMLGFQDGIVLLQSARLQHVMPATVTEIPQPAPRMGENILQGED